MVCHCNLCNHIPQTVFAERNTAYHPIQQGQCPQEKCCSVQFFTGKQRDCSDKSRADICKPKFLHNQKCLGVGFVIWGAINLLYGYGNDNPEANVQSS
jgi:hypothetical protein